MIDEFFISPGKLSVSAKDRLPLDEQDVSACHITNPAKLCFKAGNLQLGQTTSVVQDLVCSHRVWTILNYMYQ